MDFFKPKQSSSSSSAPPCEPPQPHPFIRETFANFQTHFSNFIQNNCENQFFSLFNHNPARRSDFPISNASFLRGNCGKSPGWARISEVSDAPASEIGMSVEAIEERLGSVPVYALSNPSEEFVVVSGLHSSKSLGLFCFKEEDAESLLTYMKAADPGMRQGSKVVAVALSKVFQLKADGVAFRLIPDSTQIKHALKERKKVGVSDESFAGVPVFQSQSLILKSRDKRYRPVFFRKEDLEKSLLRASRQQKILNPAFRGDIQVAVFEDIIQGMKGSSSSTWDDVVFIPPGFDVSIDSSKQ